MEFTTKPKLVVGMVARAIAAIWIRGLLIRRGLAYGGRSFGSHATGNLVLSAYINPLTTSRTSTALAAAAFGAGAYPA